MKMKKLIIASVILVLFLTGCEMPVTPTDPIADQQAQKMDQAKKVMEQTKVPTFTESLDRENIRQRLITSNDPNTLQWIYPMSAGRVIGRFPVKGKVTSGGKRLTSSQMFTDCDTGEFTGDCLVEAPDEMGTYGSSGEYVFWFDPAGRLTQHKGDYFVSQVPFKLDLGNGSITVEIDKAEESKIDTYNDQIKKSNKPTPEPIVSTGGK